MVRLSSLKYRLSIWIITVISTLVVYAHWVEPVWIEVTHHVLKANIKLPIKIAHLTDLHIFKYAFREKHLLRLLHSEAVDIILISGDSISDSGTYEEVGKFLKQLSAPLGVWLVRGNWEHWRPSENELKIYDESGIHFLNNSSAPIRDDLSIIGLDDSLAGKPDLNSALENVSKSKFKIGMFHSPVYFSKHAKAFDLVFAGHTHGGQVRFPFFPPFWTPQGSGPYVAGWYSEKETDSKMYVSRGIGNSILELRFFCRPELPIIILEPESK